MSTAKTIGIVAAVAAVGGTVGVAIAASRRRGKDSSAAPPDDSSLGALAVEPAGRALTPAVARPPGAAPAAKKPGLQLAAVYPLPELADGRKPRITSHHHARNPSRPTHDGADIFYPTMPSDPEWVVGDGGGTTNRKWIVPPGTPAIAVDSGRVQLAGNSPTGWRVWIDHGPVRSGYFHLTEIFVEQGDTVIVGEQLGLVGDNPLGHDARHLHFEVSPVDRYAPFDPAPYLQRAGFMPLAHTKGRVRTIAGISA